MRVIPEAKIPLIAAYLKKLVKFLSIKKLYSVKEFVKTVTKMTRRKKPIQLPFFLIKV
jgi:hypothetical protein